MIEGAIFAGVVLAWFGLMLAFYVSRRFTVMKMGATLVLGNERVLERITAQTVSAPPPPPWEPFGAGTIARLTGMPVIVNQMVQRRDQDVLR